MMSNIFGLTAMKIGMLEQPLFGIEFFFRTILLKKVEAVALKLIQLFTTAFFEAIWVAVAAETSSSPEDRTCDVWYCFCIVMLYCCSISSCNPRTTQGNHFCQASDYVNQKWPRMIHESANWICSAYTTYSGLLLLN